MKIKNKRLITSLLLLNTLFSNALADNELRLPDMGDSTGTLISPLQEKALGESFFRSIRAQLDISYDPDIQDYIQSLGSFYSS
jgi:predicted Zn-dependent protease